MAKTAKKITALELKSGRFIEPGKHRVDDNLYLDVRPSGRYWLFRYRSPITKTAREMGLGPERDIGLADARRAADKARQAVRDGRDPLAEKQGSRAASAAVVSPTFREAAESYIARKSVEWTSEVHAGQWPSSMAAYVYEKIGDRRVHSLTTEDILAIVEPIWASKNETAARVRGRIEKIIAAAWVLHRWPNFYNPAAYAGNLALVLPQRSKVHTPENFEAVPWRDAPAIYKRIAAVEGAGALALRFQILTAARPLMVRGAVWSEVDDQEKIWTLAPTRVFSGRKVTSGTKKQAGIIPLSDSVLAILAEARAARDKRNTSDLLFPSPIKPAAMISDMTMSAVHRRIGRAETVHGWRSTFRDWAGETGRKSDISEVALLHDTEDTSNADAATVAVLSKLGGKTRLAYQRGALFDLRRKLMAEWDAYLTGG